MSHLLEKGVEKCMNKSVTFVICAPKTVGKLFLDKGNTIRNTPDESIYFINQQAFRSGDTLRIPETISSFLEETVF